MLTKTTIKHLNQLQQKKYRAEFKEYIVEGIKGVQEALASSAEVLLVIMDGSLRDEPEMKDIALAAEKEGVQVEFCGRKDIGEIKTTDTFPGVLAVVAQNDWGLDQLADGSPIIALDGLKDPGNLGTIIRTADWFGVHNILLGPESVDPYNPKAVRSTMGSLFRVRLFESSNLKHSLSVLKDRGGYTAAGLDMSGTPLPPADLLKVIGPKTVFVFGSESHGVSPELASELTQRYTIPGKGGAESLNVAIAAAIVMSRL